MDIRLKENNIMIELQGPHVPSDFLEKELSEYYFIDKEMREILLAVGKCELPALNRHEYFALIEPHSSFVNIYYGIKVIRKLREYVFLSDDSIYIARFDSHLLAVENVEEYIKWLINISLHMQIKRLQNAQAVPI